MYDRWEIERLKQMIPMAKLLMNLGFQKINFQSRRCCCMIHKGKNPNSFSWNNDYFYCFSCLCSGDSIELVEIIKGFSFIEAVKFLSDLFGYGIRTISSFQKETKSEEREIPEYIIHKYQNQNYDLIQVNEMLLDVESKIDQQTNLLLSLKKEKSKFPEFYTRIENGFEKLDERHRYLIFERNRLMKMNSKNKRRSGIRHSHAQ